VRILTDDDKEQLVTPEDAPPSPNPIAEEALRTDPGRFIWLFKPGTPPRPADDKELAEYAARRDDPSLAWLYRVADATNAPPLPAPVAAADPRPDDPTTDEDVAIARRDSMAPYLAAADEELLAPVAAAPEPAPETGPIVITREELTQVWDEQHPDGLRLAAEPEPQTGASLPTGPMAAEDVPEPAEAPEPDATTVLPAAGDTQIAGGPGEALTALLPAQDAPTAMLPAVQDKEKQA
jgi:hypothetical protein